jgi:hypothetical protein
MQQKVGAVVKHQVLCLAPSPLLRAPMRPYLMTAVGGQKARTVLMLEQVQQTEEQSHPFLYLPCP